MTIADPGFTSTTNIAYYLNLCFFQTP